MWQVVGVNREEQRSFPQTYCLGFAFTEDKQSVLLLPKNEPEWQRGLYNGVGGKVEDGELPRYAMVREFNEETGIETGPLYPWYNFCLMMFPKAQVNCFSCTITSPPLVFTAQPKGNQKEIPAWFPLKELPNNLVENVSWLIPMALEPGYKKVYFP